MEQDSDAMRENQQNIANRFPLTESNLEIKVASHSTVSFLRGLVGDMMMTE
jgi:hypothetical protein